jgi:hypothetical protein
MHKSDFTGPVRKKGVPHLVADIVRVTQLADASQTVVGQPAPQHLSECGHCRAPCSGSLRTAARGLLTCQPLD